MTARERILDLLEENDADCALFVDEVSMRYLTRFASSDGAVIADRDGVYMGIDSRYTAAAAAAKKNGLMFDDATPVAFDRGVDGFIGDIDGKSVLVDSTRITVKQLEHIRELLPNSSIICADGICTGARRIKDEYEKSCIRKAQSITDAAFSHILEFIRPGMTEVQVAAELEYFMRRHGADGTAFETIAVSGLKGAYPHGVPDDTVLTENAFLTMDFGARYGGYCSDMTRTVVLGTASDKMKDIYNTVLRAQLAGEAAVHAGVVCSDVDKASRDIIEASPYKGTFGHGTGHSLGLEIHESPFFNPTCREIVREDTAMTVEPGIYIEGLGGVRIEDTIFVTKDGCEVVAKSDKSLIEIKR